MTSGLEANEIWMSLGGQAGNILWLLSCMCAHSVGYVPYFPGTLKQIAGIQKLLYLDFAKEAWVSVDRAEPGVLGDGTRAPAPSGGSFALTLNARRLLLQIRGLRILPPSTGDARPFEELEFVDGNNRFRTRIGPGDPNIWPTLPFFCVPRLEGRKLVVRIVGDGALETAIRGAFGFAVIGGLHTIFSDPWLKGDEDQLASVAIRQMRCLRRAGARVGVELSGTPSPKYGDFLRRLCGEDTITTLGINGEDELRDCVGGKAWDPALSIAPDQLKGGVEYETYRRALKFAKFLSVRTLYVHTNSVDFVLRRDADPGALLSAQRADLVGKGLVLGALLERAYGRNWIREIVSEGFRFAPAVSGKALQALWDFAEDFAALEGVAGAKNTLLETGIWVRPEKGEFSFAVAPVLWPTFSDQSGPGLPDKLNTTGAGDMTFGAFYFLSGA